MMRRQRVADSPVQVTVNPPISKLKRDHEKRLSKLKDMNSAYAKVATLLDRWVQSNFRTEGGKVGGWEPFAAGGRWIKGKGLDTSAKLLRDSGRMAASYLPFSSRNNAGIGSSLPYAKKHDEGLDGLPKRRTLPEKREVIGEARKIIDYELNKVTKS